MPAPQSDVLICPGCHLPFDSRNRRMLLDSCGHERCYSCLFMSQDCPLCRRGESGQENRNLALLSLSGSTVSQPVHSSSQQELYVSLKNIHYGRSTPTSVHARPPSPALSLTCPPTSSCVYGSVSGRPSLTPPIVRRSSHNPSPAGHRRNWIQRHNRRPNTVNIDQKSMAGEE